MVCPVPDIVTVSRLRMLLLLLFTGYCLCEGGGLRGEQHDMCGGAQLCKKTIQLYFVDRNNQTEGLNNKRH